MKKNITLFLLVILNVIYCNSNFQQIISKVPVTQLPFGWPEVRDADSILYRFDSDADHAKMYKPLIYDTINKYGLNNLFKFEDLEIVKDKTEYIWTDNNHEFRHLHGNVYFVARLPIIQKDEELLIYKTTVGYAPWSLETGTVPIFFLVKVNKEGQVLKARTIAGLGAGVNDFFIQLLFYIDRDHKIYLEYFLSPKFSESSPFPEEEIRKFNYNYFYKYKPWGSAIDLKNEK